MAYHQLELLENYSLAWAEVLKAFERGDVNELLCVIEEQRILRGDPNKAAPEGVIDAPASDDFNWTASELKGDPGE